MSVKDKKRYQHIVPKAHLDRFSDKKNGKVFVNKVVEGSVKCYLKNPRNICGGDNFYDEDPYADDSIESYLKVIEDVSQNTIDKIIDGKNVTSGDQINIIRYVSNLIGRSKAICEVEIITPSYFDITEEQSRRGTLAFGIFSSQDAIFFRPFSEFRCIFLMDLNETFVTADIPFAAIPLNLGLSRAILEKYKDIIMSAPKSDSDCQVKNRAGENMFAELLRNMILACPITPGMCAIIFHESAINPGNKLLEISNGDPISFINSKMMSVAIDEIYSNMCRKEEIQQFLSRNPKQL